MYTIEYLKKKSIKELKEISIAYLIDLYGYTKKEDIIKTILEAKKPREIKLFGKVYYIREDGYARGYGGSVLILEMIEKGKKEKIYIKRLKEVKR